MTTQPRAWKLLAKPNGWCRGAYARTAGGLAVYYNNPLAVSFCALGAIRAIYPTEQVQQLKNKLAKHIKHDIIQWNDAYARSKSEVVSVLKELDI